MTDLIGFPPLFIILSQNAKTGTSKRAGRGQGPKQTEPTPQGMHAKIGADLGFVVLINIIYWHGSNGLTISKLTLFTRAGVKNHRYKKATSKRWRGGDGG